jgi:RNA polymerase sigma factor (sigma-70 family)
MVVTQHSLIARLRNGGSDSDWEKFAALYKRPILAFAASRSLNEFDCCDVFQEFLIRMCRVGFSRFDPEKGRFSSFLFRVADGLVKDAIRRRSLAESRHVQLEQTTSESSSGFRERVPDLGKHPAEAAEWQGQLALVHTTLEYLLEQRCFQARTINLFKAVTFEHGNPAEVAKAFDTSVGNVYEAKRAVLAKLKRMLCALDNGFDLEEALAMTS